nr:MmgE/PrpD family protein [Acinetobacter sp. Marseille-Q1620]
MEETNELTLFLANLDEKQVPEAVYSRCKALFLDWLASAYASKKLHPIPLFEHFAQYMGPQTGKATILVSEKSTSAYFAAFVNAACSHLVEQDDLHNSSVLHPATVVFPAAFAAAQDLDISGKDFLLACITGYEAGIRIGEFLGRSHYKIFHTTATVGTLAAAVAVGKLMKFSQSQFLHLIGTAGTQAAGLWEFLKDAADSKQLHTAKAAASGLLAAYFTRDGLTGAQNILQGRQGLAEGMSSDAQPEFLNDQLGQRWALLETSFKYHASCRHTHPAADALLMLMKKNALKFEDISEITAHVHQAAIDVLGLVTVPKTIHQAKFSMGTVLGLIAVYADAGLDSFKKHALEDDDVILIRDKVQMILDQEIDKNYPKKWLGKVTVKTKKNQVFSELVTDPKGDPLNTLTQRELEEKFIKLCDFSGMFNEIERNKIIKNTWKLDQFSHVSELFN